MIHIVAEVIKIPKGNTPYIYMKLKASPLLEMLI